MCLCRNRTPSHNFLLDMTLVLVCLLSIRTVAQNQSPTSSQTPTAPVQKSGQSPEQNTEPASTPTFDGTPVAKPADENAASKQTEVLPEVKLGPGDLVEVSVYGVPELATKARISNDGELYLPLIDYVHVADLSLEEAQKLVEKRLEDGGFVRNPHVSIFVDEYSSQGVTVLGEVTKPGIYPVLGDRKLLDMVSSAGGLTDKAGRTVTVTGRNQLDKPRTVTLSRNLTDTQENNVTVHPGDTVVVHRAPIVYVVGDVGRPSGLLVDNGSLTVLQAIALAGGTNRTAKMNGARIIRKGAGGNGVTETPIALKKMLEAKAPDITLQADDILFVPVSGAKLVAGRTIEAAFAMATAVSIYAVHP